MSKAASRLKQLEAEYEQGKTALAAIQEEGQSAINAVMHKYNEMGQQRAHSLVRLEGAMTALREILAEETPTEPAPPPAPEQPGEAPSLVVEPETAP